MKGKGDIFKERDSKLKELGYSSYQEYLLSKEWLRIKLEVSKRTGRKWKFCNICGSGKNLNIHHSSYKVIGLKDPGNTVKMLCQPCHYELHNISKLKPLWSFYKICGEIRSDRKKLGLPVFEYIIK